MSTVTLPNISLSVCLPVYNHSEFLNKALETACTQSFQPSEILLLDDASTDDTWNVIQEWAARNPAIRALRNERNLGVIGSYSRLLELARGDYVHFYAADDYMLPGFYERAIRLLAAYPEAGLCFSPQLKFIERSQSLVLDGEHETAAWGRIPRFFSREELVAKPKSGYMHGNTMLIKRTALVAAGGYLPELLWNTDWFAGCVVALRHGVCFQPEPLAVFRCTEGQYSSGFSRWPEHGEVIRSMLRYLRSPAFDDVFPAFIESGILEVMGECDVAEAVVDSPDMFDEDSRRLLSRIFKRRREWSTERMRQARTSISSYTPEYLIPLVDTLVRRWTESNCRVVIMGAGEHTANLFKWTNLLKAQLVGLVDSNPHVAGRFFWSLEVRPPSQIEHFRPDVVLLSSAAAQDEMELQVRRHLDGDVEIVKLYTSALKS